ncbi:integrase catalytic domain-containing protein [Trichonephila clavipes]|nr:integrase catalytic domain-containing protein [Trichonephila clavipes]
MGIDQHSDIILHGFCDASTKAYAAVVYLKSKQEIHLVSAKTRVAPIKQLTIPRLELCGALLLAELISVIRKALRTKPAEYEWHHIPGKLNPANCATRGLSPQQLMNADYWWKGPDWINNDLKEELASAKIQTTCTVEADSVLNSIPLVVKSNPLEPIIRSKVKGQLKSEEAESAHKFRVKTIQQAKYSQEISHLKYHKPIPRSSKLLSLNIFLDEDEILRVGGRLTKQPTLSFDQKFPIIIPKHHPITTLVIRQFHLRGFHSGTQMTLSLIRQHYWIPDGRSTVRREIKRCIECCRFNSKPSYPKMGDLPKQRIAQTRPFEIVGIDFSGPILTKCQHLRKANKFKSYICLFICLATKTVNLDLVSTLSTDALLAALRRFIARRGHPSEIHSDNGTNF